jgi:hypothetical protein
MVRERERERGERERGERERGKREGHTRDTTAVQPSQALSSSSVGLPPTMRTT